MKAIDEYQVKKYGSEWVMGPMKWLIIVLGPNHRFQEIKHLTEVEHNNLNIIVVLISNEKAKVEEQHQNMKEQKAAEVFNKGDNKLKLKGKKKD